MQTFRLNYTAYPLVVGQADKITFEGWQECGSSIELNAYRGQEQVPAEELVWENSNPECVTLQNGVARALRTGFAVITAKTAAGEAATCHISVIDNYMRGTVQTIDLEADVYEMSVGDSHVIGATAFPRDVFENGAMNRKLLFASEDENVVTVNENGNMVARAEGETAIVVTSADVGRTAKCVVKVDNSGKGVRYQRILREEQQPEYVPFGLKVSCESLVLEMGESYPVYAIVTPAVIDAGTITWWVEPILEEQPGEGADVETEERSEVIFADGVLEVSSAYQNIFGASEVAVKAKQVGRALLKARYSAENGNAGANTVQGGRLVACCEIRVVGNSEVCRSEFGEKAADTAKELLRFNSDEVQIVADQIMQLPLIVDGAIRREDLLWKTSDESVVTVNPAGIVKGYKPGVARITVEYGKAADISQTITVMVEAGNAYLRNLHICEETITSDSVKLLWNRNCLDLLPGFAGYRISWKCSGSKQWYEPVHTDALGYTVENLEDDTEYDFKVEALRKIGDNIERTVEDEATETTVVIEQISAHTRSAHVVRLDVTKAPYFAVGDGRTLDTAAIQRAINDCPAGGEVYLPAHKCYLSGALFLKSDMTFRVDGVLLGSTDPAHYPRIISRWEGWRRLEIPGEQWDNRFDAQPDNHKVYASLLTLGTYEEGYAKEADYPYNIENVVICGEGMINGNGFKLAYNEGPNGYTKNGGLPVPPSPIKNATFRGSTLRIHNGKHIYVKDITIGYAPGWTVHTLYCDRLTFDHVKVISMGDGMQAEGGRIRLLNGDGIDPESCVRVNIVNCYFHTGDDAVTLKSGRNREGNELQKPVAYVRVTDCYCYDCLSGITLGSEIASGVHDVLIQNNRVESCPIFGLWIKSSEPRGGVTKHIQYKDCYVSDAAHGIMVGITAHGTTVNAADSLPEICQVSYENITFENMRGEEVELIGVPGSKLHDIIFRNIKVVGSKAGARYLLKNVRNIETD